MERKLSEIKTGRGNGDGIRFTIPDLQTRRVLGTEF